MIRPDLNSPMERYDPWTDYEVARRGRAERDAPYQGLLRLMGRLHHEPSTAGGLRDGSELPVALTSESRDHLIAWCQKNGLLGILPHRARLITMAPYRRHQVSMDEAGEPFDEELPHQNVLGLIGGAWQGVWRTTARYDAAHHPDLLLKPREIPKGWPAPSVMLEDLTLGILKFGSLKDEVWRFFPDVPADQAETFQYPLPLGERFWKEYAEPVADFLRGAVVFARAAQDLSAEEEETRQEGLRTLHAMTGAVRLTLEPGPDGYRQVWRSPSLLASFALMLLQDLANGRHVRRCEACGLVFATAAYQTRYCSLTCRSRLQKQRHRATSKKKAARAVARKTAAKRKTGRSGRREK